MRLGLSAVFAVAAVGKAADREGSRTAMSAFGVPTPLVGTAALLVPPAELAVAVALIPTASAWYGAVGALCLLAVFSAAIGWALVHGRKPDCHCFGLVYSAPAGATTLLRNLALGAVAAFVASAGPHDSGYSAWAWTSDLSTVEVAVLTGAAVVAVLVAAQSWFLWQVLKQNGNLLLRIEAVEQSLGIGEGASPNESDSRGLRVGLPAPDFSLPDLDGVQVSLPSLLSAGRPLLLVFTDPECGPCNTLLPEVAQWQSIHAADFTTVVLSRGELEANRAKAAQNRLTATLIQPDRSISEAYGCAGTPCAVLVSPEGIIASEPAGGPKPIRALVDLAVGGPDLPLPIIQHHPSASAHQHTQARGLSAGAATPPLQLPDLDGRTVDLAEFRGRRVALLFWNPGCGHCRRILPEVKLWETESNGNLAALFVSRGPQDDNRAMALQSTIVIDEGFVTGREFGASGTPSAVLIDEDGKIASPLAAGAPAVLALLSAASSERGQRTNKR
jgi:peroxiredoxin